MLQFDTLTKSQRSTLLYCESEVVDRSGLLCAQRMNGEDLENLKLFKEAGLLDYGHIPCDLIDDDDRRYDSKWVTLTELGWTWAHALRIRRATICSPRRKTLNDFLDTLLDRYSVQEGDDVMDAKERDFNARLLRDLRATGRNDIVWDDVTQWSCSAITPEDGEEVIHLNDLGVWVALKK